MEKGKLRLGLAKKLILVTEQTRSIVGFGFRNKNDFTEY
jgi:hypothetical protein